MAVKICVLFVETSGLFDVLVLSVLVIFGSLGYRQKVTHSLEVSLQYITEGFSPDRPFSDDSAD